MAAAPARPASLDEHASAIVVAIDFGTAASKIALAYTDAQGRRRAIPLAIGAAAGARETYFAPSSVFIDGARIFFGPAARARISAAEDDRREELSSFKTILGARDFEAGLGAPLRPSIDPTGSLTYRDAIVLYLAYLLALAQTSLDHMGVKPLIHAPRRYTHPVYRANAAHFTLARTLFAEAQAVFDALGAKLAASLSAEGIDLAEARSAVHASRGTPVDGRLEGDFFEAHAGALAHCLNVSGAVESALVFDMGAGTTDIAAFLIKRETSGILLSEVEPARRTLALACDEVDSILLDIFMRKWGASKSRSSQHRLWRSMKLSARKLKEDLFARGKVSLVHESKTLTVRLGDLEHEKRFKAFNAALADALGQSVAAIAAAHRDDPPPLLILAGGGAQLNFVEALAENARARGAKWKAPQIAPLAPPWAREQGLDAEAIAHFPQLAVALGAALAQNAPGR